MCRTFTARFGFKVICFCKIKEKEIYSLKKKKRKHVSVVIRKLYKIRTSNVSIFSQLTYRSNPTSKFD